MPELKRAPNAEELEKLIALSRLFRMPVGQLLGIEEPAAPETESAPAPEPAEVQQLAERIAGEHLRQQPKPRRWPRWVSLALIIGLGLGLWQTSQRLSNLEQNYWSLQSSLGALRSSVSQLQDLPSSIRQLLEEQASLTLSQSAQITTVDRRNRHLCPLGPAQGVPPGLLGPVLCPGRAGGAHRDPRQL